MERLVSAIIFAFFVNLLFHDNVFADEDNTNFTTTKPIDQVVYIVNGDPTSFDEYPFMSALGFNRSATGKIEYLGGGMLIAPNFVLTAAHCAFLERQPPSVINVGGNYLSSYYNEALDVTEVIVHPDYDDKQAYNDIALIHLTKGSIKTPVCVWDSKSEHSNNVTAIGYGATQFAGFTTGDLLKVNLTVYPEKVCKTFFKRQRKFRLGIVESHLCAGDPEGKKDTCQGDSGGPLLVNHNNRTIAVGITSTGQACSGFPPAVYTRISSFINWIEEVLHKHGQSLIRNCF